MRPRLSRRAFLKIGAALAALTYHRLHADAAPRIAATLPIPLGEPHAFFPDADALLPRAFEFDLLLIPAYAAAELIDREALAPLARPGEPGRAPGRAHDPDGAFTAPHTLAVTALVYADRAPAEASLNDLWSPGAVWPDAMRVALGAALRRRGHALNDTRSAHLRQAEQDLLRLRPRLSADPLGELRAGRAAVALAPVPLDELTARAAVPAEGGALIEYDWVVPRAWRLLAGGIPPIESRQWPVPADRGYQLRSMPNTADRRWPVAHRLLPLTPLPADAGARYAAAWARVRAAARRPGWPAA